MHKIPNIEQAFPRVGALVRSMRVPPHRMDDAMGDGLLGVAEAKAKFEPDRGVDFWTYATTYARGYILHGLRRDARNPLAPDGICDMEVSFNETVEERVYIDELLAKASQHEMRPGVNGGDLLASIIRHGDVLSGGEEFKVRPRTAVPFFRNIFAEAE